MDYLILGVGKNLYATVGIFLSGARNNPQECRKMPQNVGKSTPHNGSVLFHFSPQDGTEQTF